MSLFSFFNFFRFLLPGFILVLFCVAPFSYARASFLDTGKLASESIVFCGRSSGTAAEMSPCGVCDIFKLLKNLIDLVFFDLVPLVATLVIIYAGFVLFTKGSPIEIDGNPLKMFKSVALGLLLVYSAWLITNSLIKFFAGDLDIADSWYKFECRVTPIGTISAGGFIPGSGGQSGGGNPIDGGGDGQASGCTKPNYKGEKMPEWCCKPVASKMTTGGCSTTYKSDPNCILLSGDNEIKQYISSFSCQSAGGCYLNKGARDGLLALAKKMEELDPSGKCKIRSINSGINKVSQSNCHRGRSSGQGSDYGSCADIGLSSQNGKDDPCIQLFNKAAVQSGGVASYLIEFAKGSPYDDCATTNTTGNHAHVNLKSP